MAITQTSRAFNPQTQKEDGVARLFNVGDYVSFVDLFTKDKTVYYGQIKEFITSSHSAVHWAKAPPSARRDPDALATSLLNKSTKEAYDAAINSLWYMRPAVGPVRVWHIGAGAAGLGVVGLILKSVLGKKR